MTPRCGRIKLLKISEKYSNADFKKVHNMYREITCKLFIKSLQVGSHWNDTSEVLKIYVNLESDSW